MRFLTFVLCVTLSVCLIFVILENAEAKKNKKSKKVRAGEEEFHKYRKKQYKIAKKGSTYSQVPMLEIEDKAFWRRLAHEELEEQLKQTAQLRRAKNVIFLLGDGMSFSTVAAARILKGQRTGKWEHEKMVFDKFPYTGFLKTYTTDSQVADSAATATAYLCGAKGNLGTIGVDVNVPKEDCQAQQNPHFHTPSILHWFQGSRRSTGFVTNMRVTHATPAGAYAHIADREWEDDNEIVGDKEDDVACDDIAEQLISRAPGRNMRVILGGGRRALTPNNITDVEEKKKRGRRKDGKNLIEDWVKDKDRRGAKHRYVWNKQQLLATNYSDTDFLMGLFAWSHMDYILDRDRNMDPSLPEMTRSAISILQRDKHGFFLLVEGGLIDHGHHGNKANKALTETLEFDEAVQVALDMTSREDTLIIVSADHSHSLSINGYSSRHSDILAAAFANEHFVCVYTTNGTAKLAARTYSPDNSPDPVNCVSDYSGVDYIPYTTLLYGNGPGYRKPVTSGSRIDPSDEDIHDVNYRQAAAVPEESSTHSGEDVGVWATGPQAHMFMGVHEQSYLAHAIAYASCVGDGPTFCGRYSDISRSRRNFIKSSWSRRRPWRI